jgi:RNA polymerase sigma-70 factor (ECF subfamily)
VKGYSKENHHDDDHMLIRQSIQGDLSAFRKLVESYQKYVYSLAFRSLLHKADAEDAVQDTFIKVWLNLKYFDFRGKFTTWVYRIVVNICLDRLKRKNRHAFSNLPTIDGDLDPISLVPEPEIIDEKYLAAYIKTLAENLSSKQRMVFILRDLQDLSIKEVSQVMQITEGAVKTNLYLARTAIRMKLKSREDS